MTEPSESRDIHEQNRRSWNAITPVHNSHKPDQAKFLRGGGTTLFREELALLGDLNGKHVVHMQCNCGQDTLSLAARGATVTGVDIADEAIAFARELSRESGIAATFERADLLEWFTTTDARFDVAFTSYGGIGWLADLDAWARGVQRILAPGGRLVLIEFHPMVWSFGSDGQLADDYFLDTPIQEPGGVTDYIGPGLSPSGFATGVEAFENPEPAVSYQWTLAQTVQSLIDAGLRVATIAEYPFANGCAVIDGMEPLPGNRYGMPPGLPSMPLMWSVTAARGE